MKDSIDDALLARYLSDECNQNEKEAVEAWMNARSENRKYVELMKAAWETRESIAERTEVKTMWETVARQAGINPSREKDQVIKTKGRLIPMFVKQRVANHGWVKYAAVAVLAILTPYLATTTIQFGNHSSAYEELTIAKGKVAKLTLLDGTKITLDAGSYLKYPTKFEGTTRDVVLKGEGYFEVAKNPNKPFIIHAGDARVQVLGTKFNVSAWQENHQVTVAVTEGKVSLKHKDADDLTNPVMIQKGQFSTLHEGGGVTQARETDLKQYLAWTKNEIYFENTALDKVFSRLERWYDVSFIVEDRDLLKEHVNMQVEKKSLDDVLELLAVLTESKITQHGKTITVSQNATQ